MARAVMVAPGSNASARDARRQRGKSAQHYLDMAMASATARQSRHEKAVTGLHLAELASLQGRTVDARVLLNDACGEFERMEMHWHGEQAQQLYRRL